MVLGKRNRSWQYRAVGRQPVKSSAFFPFVVGVGGVLGVVFAGLALFPSGVSAQGAPGGNARPRPLLLGGAFEQTKEEIPLDPRLPVGRLRSEPQPFLMKSRLCSLGRPVCVASATAGNHRRELLLLERAMEEAVFG